MTANLQTNLKSLGLKALALAGLAACGWALGAAADSHFSSTDRDFLKNAAKQGIGEIQVSKLALENSSNAKVKDFANIMIRDQAKTDHDLQLLASSKGLTLPTEETLGEEATAVQLKALTGKSFDEAFVKAMTLDHKGAASAIQKEVDAADDPEVKQFAAKTLRTVQAHLDKIAALQDQI